MLNTANDNLIGTPGDQGFGVGVCPALPAGFTAMAGADEPASDNYGNYQYSDGSVVVWIPKFYYKIAANNAISIASASDYATTAAANAAGYALHRAFLDGGAEQPGFFVDKYQTSNNGGIASSIANAAPISTSGSHNPIAGLTGITANNHYSAVDAAKLRGAGFACCSRFIYAALALLSMAHGQAATTATYCAWYDAAAITNYPKGNNNNALKDTNDASVTFTADGYSSCALTGSGTPFAKTTHNGQACGVADLNGNMWEVSLGLTRDAGNTGFYALKTSIALADLTSGSDTGNDAWGSAAHLAALYDAITLPIGNASAWLRHGNGANQVLSEAVAGDGYIMTGLGIYKDVPAKSTGGTNLFGADGIYEYHRADLCVISGGFWGTGSDAGVWAANCNDARTGSLYAVGFRAACYLD